MNNKTQYIRYTRDPRFLELKLNFIFVVGVATLDNSVRKSVWPTMGLFRYMELELIPYIWIANPISYEITIAVKISDFRVLFDLKNYLNYTNIHVSSAINLATASQLYAIMDPIIDMDLPQRQVKWRVSKNIFYLVR